MFQLTVSAAMPAETEVSANVEITAPVVQSVLERKQVKSLRTKLLKQLLQ